MLASEPDVFDAVRAAVEALLPMPADEYLLRCHRGRVPEGFAEVDEGRKLV
jgi:hypothetical protein